ncbi:uncharacterized protein [Pseudorasbora parva]|uniref:uncharacterized protein isoform X2 n=1 Tax=Pseudorasbora parva TaxID=51549 RepID=UPI00351DC6DA
MMRSFQPSYLQLLYLLISLEFKAHTERACKQDHQLNINYVQGDNMSISCLTTTHPLETLTVKLRRTDPDTDILKYSETSPTSEHQRWSVRNDAGNVTLDLKDIRLSDDGLYDCQVYNGSDCLKATQFNLKVIKCEKLDSVHATPNTSVLLPCHKHPLQNSTDQVTWKIVIGHQSVEISKYHTPHKSPNKPLYERARIQANGSLLIRDAVIADGSWYQCRVSETACYEVKLIMKDVILSHSTPKLETLPTACPTYHTADSAAVTTNLTAVVMATIVSLCVLISLIICLIRYFKKRRRKINNQKINCRFSVYYSHIAEGFDVPLYSLVEQNTETMTTFGAKQTEAAYKPDHTYEFCTATE